MGMQVFGPRRSRATRKPETLCSDSSFWRCPCCGVVALVSDSDTRKDMSNGCCGEYMERIIPIPAEELPRGIELSYKIIGGPNENAVQAVWSPAHRPEWLYLKTFTGGQLKYISDKKRSPAVFALADEDAYVYCDKDPCVECTFRCKRGFILYGWFEGTGLAECPLDRMSANWRSQEAHMNEKPPQNQ